MDAKAILAELYLIRSCFDEQEDDEGCDKLEALIKRLEKDDAA